MNLKRSEAKGGQGERVGERLTKKREKAARGEERREGERKRSVRARRQGKKTMPLLASVEEFNEGYCSSLAARVRGNEGTSRRLTRRLPSLRPSPPFHPTKSFPPHSFPLQHRRLQALHPYWVQAVPKAVCSPKAPSVERHASSLLRRLRRARP